MGKLSIPDESKSSKLAWLKAGHSCSEILLGICKSWITGSPGLLDQRKCRPEKRMGNYSNSHFLAISSYVYCICDIMFGVPWVACWGEFSTEMYGNRGCIWSPTASVCRGIPQPSANRSEVLESGYTKIFVRATWDQLQLSCEMWKIATYWCVISHAWVLTMHIYLHMKLVSSLE